MSLGSKLFRTTTFRLSLIYLALFGGSAALSIGYIYWNTNVLLARQLEQTIQAEIQGLAEQYNQGGMSRLAKTVAERSQGPGNSLYLVTDSKGRRISGNLGSISRELWDAIGRVEFVYSRSATGGVEERLGFASVFRLPGGFRLIVGRDIEDRRVFERVVRSAILWGLSFMALVGLGGGWLVSRNLLSRIDAVTATSQTIMKGDLTERIPVSGSGDELDRLSINLNTMLDRIESLMAGLREVSDNIAHDLKTPLNRLRNRVEGALRDRSGEAVYREALEKTIEEADDLIKTFNALLSIARLEAGARTKNMKKVDLGQAVQDVIELYEPVAEENGLQLVANCQENVFVNADRQLIGQALSNLIDNALKYAGPVVNGTCDRDSSDDLKVISIEVRSADENAEIIVADHGPGIPEHERERVLKRFVRLEASRSQQGSGLGLSLALAVARLHKGEVRLQDNEPGLRAVIKIPLMTLPDAQQEPLQDVKGVLGLEKQI